MNTHSDYTRKLYRARDGVFFGVCRGLEKYTEIPVVWIRLIWIVFGFFTAILPTLLVYIAVALILKPEPAVALASEEEWDFYHVYSASPTMALSRLKKRFETLERRTRHLESLVTNREFDWDQRLKTDS